MMAERSSILESVSKVKKPHLAIFLFVSMVMAILFWNTIASLLNVWWVNDTYGHGFLIPFISLYLVYVTKTHWMSVSPSFSLLGVLSVGLLSLVWAAGELLHILVLQQLLLVGLLAAIIWGALGWDFLRKMLLPLSVLLFSIPIWDYLVTPVLQGITAVMAAEVLMLLGVPILLEGHYITIPSGVFLVEATCAGTRYFIVGLTLSVLFVFLVYSQWKKRAVFLAIAMFFSVLANTLRVVVVIAVGHYTEMQHPWVNDHVSLGWWLFIAFIVPLFWAGMKYADTFSEEELNRGGSSSEYVLESSSLLMGGKAFFVLLSLLLMLSLGPVSIAAVYDNDSQGQAGEFSPPEASMPWIGPEKYDGLWRAVYHGADREAAYVYKNSDQRVIFYYAQYWRQSHGKELTSRLNQVYDPEVWSPVPGENVRVLDLEGMWPYSVNEVVVRSTNTKHMVIWQWFDVAGHFTPDRKKAKFMELLKLIGDSNKSISFILAVEHIDANEARKTLRRFSEDMQWEVIGSKF